MKSIVISASAVLLSAALSTLAQAQSTELTGVYATVGYAGSSTGFSTNISGVAVGSDLKFGAVQGRLGYRFIPYFGVEGELGYGVGGDSFTAFGQRFDVKQRAEGAVYAVGFLPVSANFDIFVRGGYGGARYRATAPGFSARIGGNSWNYGAGAQLFIDGKNGIRGDYTRKSFSSDEAQDADVWSISYVRRF